MCNPFDLTISNANFTKGVQSRTRPQPYTVAVAFLVRMMLTYCIKYWHGHRTERSVLVQILCTHAAIHAVFCH